MNKDKIKCGDFEEHINDFYDKSLDSDLSLQCQEHMEDCSDCKERYDMYVEMINVLKEDILEPDELFHNKIMNSLVNEGFILENIEVNEKIIENDKKQEIANLESEIADMDKTIEDVKQNVNVEHKETKEKNGFSKFFASLTGKNKKYFTTAVSMACLAVVFVGAYQFIDRPTADTTANGVSENAMLSSEPVMDTDAAVEPFSLGSEMDSSISTDDVSTNLQSAPATARMGTRVVFEPITVPDDKKVTYVNIDMESSLKSASELFQKLQEDSNITVTNQSIGDTYEQYFYANGTSTLDIDEFMKYFDKNVEYSTVSSTDISDIVNDYNIYSSALADEINTLETMKANFDSKAKKAELESKITELISEYNERSNYLNNYINDAELTFNINGQNKSYVPFGNIITMLKEDGVSAINYSFVTAILLVVGIVALFIFKKPLMEVPLLNQKRSIFAKVLLGVSVGILVVVTCFDVFSRYNYSYNYSVSTDSSKPQTEEAIMLDDFKSDGTPDNVEYSGYINVESKNVDKAKDKADKIVEKYNGFIENETYSKDNYIYYTVRVPKENYLEAYSELCEVGDIVSSSNSATDHSDTVDNLEDTNTDLQSQINAYDETIKSYKESLGAYDNTADVIAMADAICQTQIQRDFNQFYLDNIESRVSYSTIEFSANEKDSDVIFLQNGFIGRVLGTIISIATFLLSTVIIGIIPVALIYGAYLLVKKIYHIDGVK